MARLSGSQAEPRLGALIKTDLPQGVAPLAHCLRQVLFIVIIASQKESSIRNSGTSFRLLRAVAQTSFRDGARAQQSERLEAALQPC